MPSDAGPRARLARRSRGVPARPGAADADGRLRAAEPVRGLPRGAVRAGQAGLRAVAADEVPLVRRARRARLRDARGPRRQEPARAPSRRRGCSTRSAAPSSPSRTTTRCCATSPRPGRPSSRTCSSSSASRRRSYGGCARRSSAAARSSRAASSTRSRTGTRACSRAGTSAPEACRRRRAPGAGRRGRPGGGLAPEPEVRRWFPWWAKGLVEGLGPRGATGAARGGLGGGGVIRELRREDAAAVARLALTINPHLVVTPEVVWHRAIAADGAGAPAVVGGRARRRGSGGAGRTSNGRCRPGQGPFLDRRAPEARGAGSAASCTSRPRPTCAREAPGGWEPRSTTMRTGRACLSGAAQAAGR